ncbi:hypothetical protein MWH25_08195 [Natroniella acetigena]|uniref:hypothetical protein n=1 Tax=Natroniella acetigena TaxID=52004 RepID=UPI00200B7048|nr:hypothetical protein [Natroniella acetigena]MCK8827723.1 hypothetical protein [Natroniella acetigena]
MVEDRNESDNKEDVMKELGSIGQSHSARFHALGDEEYLPKRWPQNIDVYNKMKRSDGQVQAMLLVMELPIRSTKWFVEPYSDSAKDKEIAKARIKR